MADNTNMAQAPERETPPTPASIKVSVIRENHEAEMFLQRTGSNTINPTINDLKAALQEKGITTGIKDDLLAKLSFEPVYNEKLVIAVGKRPQVGTDGELRYKIPTSRSIKPAINEDGSVDYKNMGYTNNVEEGQELVEIVSPTIGESGIDVFGAHIPGLMGKETFSPKGEGTVLSEDGTKLLAKVAGNAVYNKGVISIQEILKIRGDIDNATGDITFSGDIMIGGDVSAGFKVTSLKGNISIKGIVDAAFIQAKGDIVIGEGINGMNRGTITAGGNIKSRFVQNCLIRAGGDIFADTIMYATVECDGNVELNGKRGQLIGGTSTIAGKLTAKSIGNQNHVATQLTMSAGSITKQRELEELKANIKNIDLEITKLVQILNRFEEFLKKQKKLDDAQMKTVEQVKENYKHLTERRRVTVNELQELEQARLKSGSQSSYAECKGKVYTGVRFSFGPLNYMVQNDFINSRVGVIDGEIKLTTL